VRDFRPVMSGSGQTLTCVGAVLRRRFSFHNPRIRRSSSSAAAKMACRSSLAMWTRQRRPPREARHRPGTTRRTRKGPWLPVRQCRWRKRRLPDWRHRQKRCRLPVQGLRLPLPRRARARFGLSVSLISKLIFRRSYARRSRRQSLAQGSHPRDRSQSSRDSVGRSCSPQEGPSADFSARSKSPSYYTPKPFSARPWWLFGIRRAWRRLSGSPPIADRRLGTKAPIIGASATASPYGHGERLEIQLELGRCLHRQVVRLLALKDALHI
jgi:hypothetical protein